MGSILVPKWGQACNSTVYRTLWPSVKHFFRFPSNFFEKPLWRSFQLFHPFPVENFSSTTSCGFFRPWTQEVQSRAPSSFLMYYKLHYRNIDAGRFLWYTNLVSAALLKTSMEWMFYGFFQGRFRGRSGVLQNADGRADL